MKAKLKLLVQKFFEAWAACSTVMVQGDLSALTMKHFIIAGKTGLLTGIAFVIISFTNIKSKHAPIWLTGVLTSIADILIHPTHFGPHYAEELTTGVLAAAFAYVFTKFGKDEKALEDLGKDDG